MTNRAKICLFTLGVVLALIGVRGWLTLRSQPQLPTNDDVFKTVDALFTAITARDHARLTACEAKLESLKTTGQIPAAAAKRLTILIAAARAGQWESAARQLYDFIQGQRRQTSTSQAPTQPATASDRVIR